MNGSFDFYFSYDIYNQVVNLLTHYYNSIVDSLFTNTGFFSYLRNKFVNILKWVTDKFNFSDSTDLIEAKLRDEAKGQQIMDDLEKKEKVDEYYKKAKYVAIGILTVAIVVLIVYNWEAIFSLWGNGGGEPLPPSGGSKTPTEGSPSNTEADLIEFFKETECRDQVIDPKVIDPSDPSTSLAEQIRRSGAKKITIVKPTPDASINDSIVMIDNRTPSGSISPTGSEGTVGSLSDSTETIRPGNFIGKTEAYKNAETILKESLAKGKARLIDPVITAPTTSSVEELVELKEMGVNLTPKVEEAIAENMSKTAQQSPITGLADEENRLSILLGERFHKYIPKSSILSITRKK